MTRKPSAAASQLPLDLGHRPALRRDDFLVAPCNRAAVAWLDRWPDWPGPALAVHGPPGCGKTHLASVWRARSGAIAVEPAALADPSALAAAARTFVLDGV
ncbi:MAG TPA: DNA replication protein, partial [Dongiaceae bacterium]|nr:DNA replication protein [Dongiaceae bacterium]